MELRVAVARALARALPALAAASLALAGDSPSPRPPAGPGTLPLVVLPAENLTGRVAPLAGLEEKLRDALAARGVALLPPDLVDEVLERHRIRYTGGVGGDTAAAFREDGGADTVLVTSLVSYDPTYPPRIALESRLVSIAGEAPVLRFTHGVALAGDDRPGAFDLGLVHDVAVLLDRAVEEIATQAAAFLEGGPGGEGSLAVPRAEGRFAPTSLFVSRETLPFGPAVRRVAIMPFVNDTARRNAGEIVALVLGRVLSEMEGIEVVEPGVVRQVLLDTRLIQEEGVSQVQADMLRGILEADMVIGGRVSEFKEDTGNLTPRVEFSAYGLDTRGRQVTWVARTHAEGNKRVAFFGLGAIRSAARLADEMAKGMLRDVARRSGRR